MSDNLYKNTAIPARPQAALMGRDPACVDVIVRRWQDATGGHVTLEGSGEAFNAIAAARNVLAAA